MRVKSMNLNYRNQKENLESLTKESLKKGNGRLKNTEKKEGGRLKNSELIVKREESRDYQNRIFESDKFTSKDLEDVLWDTLKKVQKGKITYDEAIATTALGRTLCMMAKIRIQAKYVSRMSRIFTHSDNKLPVTVQNQ